MANKTWAVASGVNGNYGTAANWSPSGVPIAGDNVRIPVGSGNISSGLDQSAVAIADFIVELGYAGSIGSVTEYLKIDPDRFDFSGNGVAYINLGSAAIAPSVYNTATPGTGLRGLYLLGSALTVLNAVKGSIGVASRIGETSTVATIRCLGASVYVGSGVTLTTFYQTAGDSEVHCACTTITCYGGKLKTAELGAITTITVEGGEVKSESSGTVTNVNANGGTVDALGSGIARTWTNLKQNPRSTVKYSPSVLTITNRLAPDYPISLTASAA